MLDVRQTKDVQNFVCKAVLKGLSEYDRMKFSLRLQSRTLIHIGLNRESSYCCRTRSATLPTHGYINVSTSGMKSFHDTRLSHNAVYAEHYDIPGNHQEFSEYQRIRVWQDTITARACES